MPPNIRTLGFAHFERIFSYTAHSMEMIKVPVFLRRSPNTIRAILKIIVYMAGMWYVMKYIAVLRATVVWLQPPSPTRK